jgi:hypothetical protein
MPKKRFSAEQIVTLLRQIEVSMAQGKSEISIVLHARTPRLQRRTSLSWKTDG